MKLYQLYFSPTGGTKKAAQLLCTALPGPAAEVDLSVRDAAYGQYRFQPDDICLVAVPAFGGRVPAVALEHLSVMQGGGAQAILVAVYGNRAFDDTLLELHDTLTRAGFCCRAAVSAVAEHSIMHQFGHGRPDADDADVLAGFSEALSEHLSQERDTNAMQVPGNTPYREYHGVPFHPKAGKACVKCGLCAQKCPVGAIPPAAPNTTDTDQCMSCMRCAAICPHHARSLNAFALSIASHKMKKACLPRKENKLYL